MRLVELHLALESLRYPQMLLEQDLAQDCSWVRQVLTLNVGPANHAATYMYNTPQLATT